MTPELPATVPRPQLQRQGGALTSVRLPSVPSQVIEVVALLSCETMKALLFNVERSGLNWIFVKGLMSTTSLTGVSPAGGAPNCPHKKPSQLLFPIVE